MVKKIIILGICLLGCIPYRSPNIQCKEFEIRKIPTFKAHSKPTPSLVKEACEYYGLLHSDIVVAQSILETGYYTSNVCIKHKNLFGLYDSYNKRYYRFNAWWESVEGYKNKVQYKLGKSKCSEEEYYHFLKVLPYAEDPDYINKIKTIVKRITPLNYV